MIIGMRHTGIVVRDIDKALAFWKNLMGLTVAVDYWEQGSYIDTLQKLNGVRVRIVKLTAPDVGMIELLHDVAHPTPAQGRNLLCDSGIRHIAFTVRDAQQAWLALQRTGCEQ